MAKKKKERKPEEPVIESGLGGLGGIFKGIGEFVSDITKLAEEAAKLEKIPGVEIERKVTPRGMYGITMKAGPRGPVLSRFGTIKPTLKPGVPEVREPLVDVLEDEGEVTIIAELPGVEEKDIKTEVEERKLRIDAETKDRKYSKEIELPAAVTGELKTTYKNGVLEVKLKKKL